MHLQHLGSAVFKFLPLVVEYNGECRSSWAFLEVLLVDVETRLGRGFLRGVEPIFRQHLLHHTAVLGKVERPNCSLVQIPVIFSEVGGHDELDTARR